MFSIGNSFQPVPREQCEHLRVSLLPGSYLYRGVQAWSSCPVPTPSPPPPSPAPPCRVLPCSTHPAGRWAPGEMASEGSTGSCFCLSHFVDPLMTPAMFTLQLTWPPLTPSSVAGPFLHCRPVSGLEVADSDQSSPVSPDPSRLLLQLPDSSSSRLTHAKPRCSMVQ